MATEDSTPALPVPDLPISPSPSTPLTFAPRKLTVSYIDRGVSYLRLRGRWLDQAGFHPRHTRACRSPAPTPYCGGGGPSGGPSLRGASLSARNQKQETQETQRDPRLEVAGAF